MIQTDIGGNKMLQKKKKKLLKNFLKLEKLLGQFMTTTNGDLSNENIFSFKDAQTNNC